MRAFGYPRGDDEAETPIELREVSILVGSIDELERLRSFLDEVIATRTGARGPWHLHLRDRDARWVEGEADVIVCMAGEASQRGHD